VPDQPRFVVDFPALFVAPDWVQAHCVVPDGFEKGEPFGLVDWQAWSLLNFYRVREDATVGQLAPAFFYRRAQVVLPQKAGKAPYTAAHVCVEAVGPAVFAGWAVGGERWDCRDHGCGCGWAYEYEPGEAMGVPWPTPLIQITATSEEQTDNIYAALRPMIEGGPLSDVIRKTGEEFIRLPGGGRIDVVTSSARSRLGQRVTFVPQDETGIWTPQSGMVRVAETQRRGLAGMGGRAEETTNAWDPAEGSVAQRTADAAGKTGDIFRYHPEAPAGLSYRNKQERRRIHRIVYRGCRWVDLDAIDAEAQELLEVDAPQAERFFGNRTVAGVDRAFDPDHWVALGDPARVVPPGALIVIGVDGARSGDALALVATEVASGFQWPLGVWEAPEPAPDGYEHPQDDVDGAVVDALERFTLWRMYVDPQYIEHLLREWQGRYGRDRVHKWLTSRPKPIAWAVRAYMTAVAQGDVSHDADETFARHIANARRQYNGVRDDQGRKLFTLAKEAPMSPMKMDAAMAAVLSWEARSDAIASGALEAVPEEPAPTYGHAFL
jgi:hypothetical protein